MLQRALFIYFPHSYSPDVLIRLCLIMWIIDNRCSCCFFVVALRSRSENGENTAGMEVATAAAAATKVSTWTCHKEIDGRMNGYLVVPYESMETTK